MPRAMNTDGLPNPQALGLTESGVALRFAFPDDDHALVQLAMLDSSEPLARPILIAEVGEEVYAALSLADGAVIADPFRPTATLVELLQARSKQLKRTARDNQRRVHPARRRSLRCLVKAGFAVHREQPNPVQSQSGRADMHTSQALGRDLATIGGIMQSHCTSEHAKRVTSPAAPIHGRSPSPATSGLLSGLLAGVCCVAGAAAVGLGLGGATFFSTVMNRYQAYLMLASLALMALSIARTIRGSGAGGRGIRGVARAVRRPVIVMGMVYGLTLVLAFAASRAAGLS